MVVVSALIFGAIGFSFFGPLGILIGFALAWMTKPNRKAIEQREIARRLRRGDLRPCPACREPIVAQATRCPVCRSDVSPVALSYDSGPRWLDWFLR